MGEFSISHLLILAVILLFIFGPSRLPGLGQSLGKAIRGFKDGLNEGAHPPAKDVSLTSDSPRPETNNATSSETSSIKSETKTPQS